MKKRSKYQQKIWWCRLIVSVVQVLLFLFCPIILKEGKTCGARVIFTMIVDTGFQIRYILLMLCMLPALLYLIRFILLIRNKSLGVLEKLSAKTLCWLGISIFVVAVLPVSQDDFSKTDIAGMMLVYCLFVFSGGIEFLYCRCQETMEDTEEEVIAAREKEKIDRQHRKKANYFPGKYPKEFYQVIRRMFRSRIKVQMLMIASEAFAAASLFIVFSMYGIMKDTYEMESSITGDGLYGLFRSLGLILILLHLVMMTMMSAWYIKEAKKDFRLLVILGIRRRTVYMQFLLEFWTGVLVAAVFGLGAGAAGASAMRMELQKGIPGGAVFPEVVTGNYFLIGLISFLILMGLSLAFNQENFIDLGQSVDRNEDVQKEERLRKGISLWIAGGVFLAALAVGWYSVREWAESRFIHILTVVAMFLLLSGGTALWMRIRERKHRYDTGLLKRNLFYHKFESNIERLFLLAVIQFLALGMFAAPMAGACIPQKIPSMYPYDIVVTAYEPELEKLEVIADKYEARVTQYPMLRMTSIYGSDKIKPWRRTTRPIQWPQGQQIAISESTYQQMRKFVGKEPKKLSLQGEELHVVYQQDLSVKAHTIDWDTGRLEKHLRFGQPLEYYNPDDFRRFFPVRTIAGEERASLTGSFHQGMQDNLIVLTDSYFQENYDRITAYNRKNWETRQKMTREEWRMYTVRHPENLTEGPTTLFCMNLDDALVDQAAADLEYLNEEQDFDTVWDNNIQPFYVKSQMIVNTESEIFFTRMGNGFILLVLMILGVFQFFVKVKSEEDNWRWENIFLKRLGMHEKERKAKLRYQIRMFVLIPVLSGITGGVIFAALTAKARLYTMQETLQFAGYLGMIYLIWILVWAAVCQVMNWNIWKHVEKE